MAKTKNTRIIKNYLSEILKEKGMTAEELAKSIGVTPPTMSTFKNLKSNLSMENIVDITKVLNITIGELFGETPINYGSIVNIKYINDINLFSSCEELENKNNFDSYGISSDLLKIFGIKKTTNLIITKVSNNSMYDTISPTDYIIIDLSEQEVERDGLFLIKEQGKLQIRRININEDNNLSATFDNKRFVGGMSRVYDRNDNIICGRVLKIIKNDI